MRSVHAQNSQANILNLDQKARKCIRMTCKQLCGKFYKALYIQTMTRKLLNQLPNVFFGKIPRSEWVNTLMVPFYNYFLIFDHSLHQDQNFWKFKLKLKISFL